MQNAEVTMKQLKHMRRTAEAFAGAVKKCKVHECIMQTLMQCATVPARQTGQKLQVATGKTSSPGSATQLGTVYTCRCTVHVFLPLGLPVLPLLAGGEEGGGLGMTMVRKAKAMSMLPLYATYPMPPP